MARKKLVSRPLDKLNSRILGIKSIDDSLRTESIDNPQQTRSIDGPLVLSNGLSTDNCTNIHNELKAAIDDQYISGMAYDAKVKLVRALEKKANEASKKILLGVVNDFGDNSPHVSKVGGIPVSERAKPTSAASKAEKAAAKAAAKAAKKG